MGSQAGATAPAALAGTLVQVDGGVARSAPAGAAGGAGTVHAFRALVWPCRILRDSAPSQAVAASKPSWGRRQPRWASTTAFPPRWAPACQMRSGPMPRPASKKESLLRLPRGIEVTEETLSFETIRDVVRGPGHYLGHSQTLSLMESEYIYPGISDRRSYGEWGGDRTARHRRCGPGTSPGQSSPPTTLATSTRQRTARSGSGSISCFPKMPCAPATVVGESMAISERCTVCKEHWGTQAWPDAW